MVFGRTKIITFFALFGFFLGAATYSIFNWFAATNIIRIMPISLVDIVLSPWFVSGIVGAALSMMIVIVFARFSGQS